MNDTAQRLSILMVEDDPDITILLVNYLKGHGMDVTAVVKPSEGIARLQDEAFDLIILDLTLPEMDGLEVCRLVRRQADIPIIISSARGDIDDKLVGFERGADDYLPKPYEPRELIARIHSVMRRYVPSNAQPQERFVLSEARHEIRFEEMVLELTPAEFEVLASFIRNKGRIVSREELIEAAPSISWNSSERTVDVIVSRLRQKIETDPKHPRHIRSVRSRGYRFDG